RERSVIVSVLVPRFALLVAARHHGALPSEAAALGPEPGGAAGIGVFNAALSPGGPRAIGYATAAAATFGVTPGMRVGEALARCPRLQLVTADPGAVADAGEAPLQRLGEVRGARARLGPVT